MNKKNRSKSKSRRKIVTILKSVHHMPFCIERKPVRELHTVDSIFHLVKFGFSFLCSRYLTHTHKHAKQGCDSAINRYSIQRIINDSFLNLSISKRKQILNIVWGTEKYEFLIWALYACTYEANLSSKKKNAAFILHSNSSVDDSYYMFIATPKVRRRRRRRLWWYAVGANGTRQRAWARARIYSQSHIAHSTAQHSSQQTFSKFHDSTQHLQNSLQTKPVDINRIHIYFIKCSIALSNHA